MVFAWLQTADQHGHLVQGTDLIKSFYEWVQLQVQSQKVEFTVKGKSSEPECVSQ